MEKEIRITINDSEESIMVPFDNPPAGKYEIEVDTDNIENGDGVILKLDKDACLSFAKIFGSLALGSKKSGYHVHLGYDEKTPEGPGFRIKLVD